MNDLEKLYRKQPLRPLPDEWRAEILSASSTESAATAPPTRKHRSPIAWFFDLIPKPLAFPLAAAWMIIGTLLLLTPVSQPSSIAQLVASNSEKTRASQIQEAVKIRTMIWVAWQEQSKLLASLESEDVEPDSTIVDPNRTILP
ncbi:MAG: hypothetical protein ACI9R3_000620 [Verrucomicrobiales bacterium]|jgi:hypothetical protein